MLPSDYRPMSQLQPISENYVWFLLETVLRKAPTVADRELFAGCKTIEDIMFRLSESEVIRTLFLNGPMDGIGRLGEFYIALRTMKEWAPRAGYDLRGVFEYLHRIEAGTIEVKTLSPSKTRPLWDPRITGNNIELRADVLIVLGMHESINPCDATLFAIPRHALEGAVAEHLARSSKDRPRISIRKQRINPQTRKQNPWYEYEVLNHSMVKDFIAQYVHGDFGILPQQMEMILFQDVA